VIGEGHTILYALHMEIENPRIVTWPCVRP
jgi:hypothetical protein